MNSCSDLWSSLRVVLAVPKPYVRAFLPNGLQANPLRGGMPQDILNRDCK